MKRFFLVSALAIVSSTVIRIIFNSVIVYAAFLVLVLLFGLLLNFKSKRKILISLICFILTSALMFLYTDGFIKNRVSLDSLKGTTKTFKCTIVEEPEFNGENYIYVVEPQKSEFKDINYNFKIRLNCKFNIGAEAYDRLEACVDIKELSEKTKLNYFADNVMLSGKLRYCAVEKVNSKPLFYLVKKRIIAAFTDNENSDITGIPIAISTGDKSYISDKLYRDIKATGMAHVMAVSGFHISVICMGIVLLMRKLKFGKKISAIVGLITLFLLAGVAGFTGSVLRAGIMYIIIFLGELISRRPDALNSLGFAITLLCIINPYSIFSISLLLSAMGTLGILLLSPPLTKYLIDGVKFRGIFKKIYTVVMGILVVSLPAGVFVLPVSLYTFGYISVISVIVNLFITLPVYIIIFSAIFYVIFCSIPYLSTVLLGICKTSSYVFKYIIGIFADLDFAVFYKDDILLYVIVFSAILLCFLIYVFRKRTLTTVILSILMACTFVTSLTIQHNINSNRTRLTFVPSNSGYLVIAESRGDTAVITSTKDSGAIYDAYYSMYDRLNERIDYLLIASDDSSVLEKSIKLSEKLEVDKIALCKNTGYFKLNEIEFNILNIDGEYDVLVYLPNETLLVDDGGTSSYKTDYILTRNPLISYKLNGNHSKYIIDGDRDSAVIASGYINKQGGKTAILSEFGIITSEKISNNVLKFQR